MTTNSDSLLVGGTTGWHNGTQTVYYSFLGSTIPSYYNVSGGMVELSSTVSVAEGTNVQMTAGEEALTLLAIQAWNAVANVNLTPGTINGGGGGGAGAPITGNGALVGGLGGTAGYGETELPRNDDGSTSVDISAVFESGLNFFGNTYTSMFVNTNGNISFNSSISTFTPTGITGAIAPMIAAFWADVDTRAGNPIYVDLDTVNDVVTITWAGVGYFNQHPTPSNSFQMQLFDRGGGDFDIVFRYADINWTAGDFSGGSGGLGGTPARAGYSAGNGTDFFELTQSGNEAAMLTLENTLGNTGVQGLWVFEVRNGAVAVGDITFGAADMGQPSLYGFAYLPVGSTLGVPSVHGDLWINRGNVNQNAADYGNDGWQTYLHELGHALGLHHPNDDPNNTAGDPTNNNQYTVMSYVPHPGTSVSWPITPMIYDIEAMQQLYGPNLSTNTGNTNYFGPSAQYALDDGGLIQGSTYVAIATVWDAGGIDTFNFTNQTGDLVVDIRPGRFSTVGAVANNIATSSAVTVGGQVVNLIENVDGGSGNDSITGNQADNLLRGYDGNDWMSGALGNDTMYGNVGNDSLFGGDGDDSLRGNDGNDRLDGGVGVDTIEGGTGNDTITGYDGGDRIFGNVGDDTIRGQLGIDTMYGGAGLDTIYGDAGADRIFGEDDDDELGGNGGNDYIDGGLGADLIKGGVGDDTLLGSDGADVIFGAAGNDSIDGGVGWDHISGGPGSDTMTGGLGRDVFHFNLSEYGADLRATVDRITDFTQAQGDLIDLHTQDAIAGNGLPGDNYTFIGNAAFSNVAGQLHYVWEGGNTYIEADRNGDGVADWAIRLDGQITLTVADFIL